MPPATALIVLVSMFEMGFPVDGNVSPHSTAPSQELPPAGSAPTTIRDSPASTWRVYIDDVYVLHAARRVIEEAAGWLSFTECQQLLVDFADERGQQLNHKLAALSVTAVEYLRLIVFEDGANRGRCRHDGVLAFTSPGSRVIYLCGRDFMRAAQREPENARAVVIHEMLHSLGLGENPPSSKEITRRVRDRCWR